MIFKKNFLLFPITLIIIFLILLDTNNKQSTSFRFFKWSVQEVSIGKIISISFISGILISTFLDTTINSFKKYTPEDGEEKYEPLDSEENITSKIEMPPQRDIRDAQPTISVNYRVVKNSEENNLKKDQNYSNDYDNEYDWNDDDNGW